MTDVTVLKAPAPVDVDEIRRRVRKVLAQQRATKAFLVGSYARGSADAWSDADLIVVMPTDRPLVERPLALAQVLDALPIPVDLLVYTPEEFDRGMARGFGIFEMIRREGVQIL